VPENKVVSLDERAKDEEKPFLEQLLQEGSRKLLQAAIENEVIDYIQFHKDRLLPFGLLRFRPWEDIETGWRSRYQKQP
jgi:hypothetical protein